MDAPAPIGTIAHYTLLERLDPAGPGDLFRGRDTRLGRTVTVRVVPRESIVDDESRGTLIQKAREVIGLSHPNITAIFDAGEHDGGAYVVFEFVKGQSLRAEMAGRQMKPRRAAEIAVQIADAIAAAHAAGFVHGGLSPDSVMVTAKGHAKIPALELAARGGFEQHAGEARLRDYDSPEEAKGGAPDDRSDIYSVGAILYEMLTARRPIHRGAAAPSTANGQVSKELDDVVLKAVAPNPDLRYQSAAALAAELRTLVTMLDMRSETADVRQEASRQSTSMARVLTTALIILAGVAAIVWWVIR